ncbi:unnamed protein product [Clavelina lepadiformis]|uniref:Uncharacterized protein n=1 Tax=Clavelina lepadiformis TaxID=159417 RepID=A0ABP0GA08_CLALP
MDQHVTLSTVPSYRHLRTETIGEYGQLISDNIVLPGVHLLESYRPARSFVFRVHGDTVLYHNYTLSHEHVRCTNSTYLCRLYTSTTMLLTTRRFLTSYLTPTRSLTFNRVGSSTTFHCDLQASSKVGEHTEKPP